MLMKAKFITIFATIFSPFAAFSAREGTPAYYQNANQANQAYYQNQGFTDYVGPGGTKQVIGQRVQTYQVPRQTAPVLEPGAMTLSGIAMPDEAKWVLSADYYRRYANFKFETGVNSILEWDDMIFNTVGVRAQHNFALRDFDLFIYGDYQYGSLSHGGLSMDYDLSPYDPRFPDYGIFTISVGDMSGSSNHMRFGFGARNIWNIGGWQISPSIGYEIFKHNLEMSNHIYPNPGIYLPLMTNGGDYVFGDDYGHYFTVPQADAQYVAGEGFYQVCMSPEDIKLVDTGLESGFFDLGTAISTIDYNPIGGEIPWGVPPGSCVVIGGDGQILVEGTTHIYNTTWQGIYFGLDIEKQMTLNDKLRFYFQVGLPSYKSEGIWPNRTDWQQNPSFIDEGNNGSLSYRAEIEYNYKLSERLQLSIGADLHYFHVGKIGGQLFVAEYSTWILGEDGLPVLDDNGWPILETVPAHTEDVTDSLKYAEWQSFAVRLGLKYAF